MAKIMSYKTSESLLDEMLQEFMEEHQYTIEEIEHSVRRISLLEAIKENEYLKHEEGN